MKGRGSGGLKGLKARSQGAPLCGVDSATKFRKAEEETKFCEGFKGVEGMKGN